MKLSDDYNAFGGFATQIWIITLILGCGASPFLVIGGFSIIGILSGVNFFLFIGIVMIVSAGYVMWWGGNKQEKELAKRYGMSLERWRNLGN